MLILYGILFIIIENRNRYPRYRDFEDISYKTALMIGCFQALALIPGTSRSGATILGAILIGTSRSVAAEFSFFLAVPTMFGATLYKMYKLLKEGGTELILNNMTTLIVGNVVAFVVAMLAIKFFIEYVQKYGFKAFGWYRIIVGGIILVLLLTGHNLTII